MVAKRIKGLIDFTYELPGGGSRTIKLAAPILPEGEELSHPFEDYFPQESPALWFSMSIRQQNDYIKGVVMGGACPIFGYPVLENGEQLETHHEYYRGLGGRLEACAPWAMVPGLESKDPLRSAHTLYHQRTLGNDGFTLIKWDFLNEEDGFVVEDEQGNRIEPEKLWYYTRPTPERVAQAAEWLEGLRKANLMLVDVGYQLGIVYAKGDEYAKLLGFGSVASCCAQHAIGNDIPSMMAMLFRERGDIYATLAEHHVIPEAADLYRRRTKDVDDDVKNEWEEKLLQMCSPRSKHPSFQAFGQLIRMRFPPEARLQKVTVLNDVPESEIEETESLDPVQLAREGKTVIGGHRIRVPEPPKKTPLEEEVEKATSE